MSKIIEALAISIFINFIGIFIIAKIGVNTDFGAMASIIIILGSITIYYARLILKELRELKSLLLKDKDLIEYKAE